VREWLQAVHEHSGAPCCCFRAARAVPLANFLCRGAVLVPGCSLHGWATWLRRAYADVGASGRAKTASACSFVFCVARWQGLRCHCSDIQSLCRRACLIWRLPRARVGCLGAWGCLVVSVLIRCATILCWAWRVRAGRARRLNAEDGVHGGVTNKAVAWLCMCCNRLAVDACVNAGKGGSRDVHQVRRGLSRFQPRPGGNAVPERQLWRCP
jgi:hypothetical protein